MNDLPGIMKVVNEVHRLRNENAVLRDQLDQMNVRMDEFLEKEPNIKRLIHYVHVRTDALTFMVNRDRAAHELAYGLSKMMLMEVPRIAQKVEVLDKDSVEYRFAFLRLPK